MTTTTDPRTVTTGAVEISATSAAKRDALIGRWATYRTFEDGIRVGRVESLEAASAVLRFPDGRWAMTGRTVNLVPEPDESQVSIEAVEAFAGACRDASDAELRDWAVQISRGVDDATPLPTYQERVALLRRIHAEQQRRRDHVTADHRASLARQHDEMQARVGLDGRSYTC